VLDVWLSPSQIGQEDYAENVYWSDSYVDDGTPFRGFGEYNWR
jgi:hypothetical protein